MARAKHRAIRASFSASTPERYTRSPQTTGVAAAQPGKSAFHAMFSVRLHSAGKFFSSLDPLNCGPRHCGQSPAHDHEPIPNATITAQPTFRMEFLLL